MDGLEEVMNLCLSSLTHRLIAADRMDLSPKHDCREDQKEEPLEAEQDEEDDGCWWGKITALWRREATKIAYCINS